MTGPRFIACAALVLVFGCGGGAKPTAGATPSFPLPDSGWKPGDPSLLALAEGPFHAHMTARGACATIGKSDAPVSYRWPSGYRVRFHPTQLLDAHGAVIAADGDQVKAAGGLTGIVAGTRGRQDRPVVDTWCG